MKFDDWLLEKTGFDFLLDSKHKRRETKKLYIIGTCDSCEFYNNEPNKGGDYAVKIIANAIGAYKCGNEESVYHDRYCGDGCIHWEGEKRKEYKIENLTKGMNVKNSHDVIE